jgi:hypothetical protein
MNVEKLTTYIFKALIITYTLHANDMMNNFFSFDFDSKSCEGGGDVSGPGPTASKVAEPHTLPIHRPVVTHAPDLGADRPLEVNPAGVDDDETRGAVVRRPRGQAPREE